MPPKYSLKDIQIQVDEPTYDKAVKLYRTGKVGQLSIGMRGYSATVQGTEPYEVSVSQKDIFLADCNCYVGQSDTLCKHAVAVALAVVANLNGAEFESSVDTKINNEPSNSNSVGTLSLEQSKALRKAIGSITTKYIRSYDGPSSTWFYYQNKLDEGCKRLANIVSTLPICKESAELLITMIVQLDKKLATGGVDDSNGTVGNFMTLCVNILAEQSQLDSKYLQVFKRKLPTHQTTFDWEKPLQELANK